MLKLRPSYETGQETPGRGHRPESAGLGDRLVFGGERVRNSTNPKLLALEHRELLLYLSLNHYVYIIHRESKDAPASGNLSVSH